VGQVRAAGAFCSASRGLQIVYLVRAIVQSREPIVVYWQLNQSPLTSSSSKPAASEPH